MPTYESYVEQAFILQFQSAIDLALQQMGPKLRPFVDEQTCRGEQSVSIHLVDPVDAVQSSGRLPENVDNPVALRRRWLVFQPEWVSGQAISEEDVLRQLADPRSEIVQSHAAAIGRKIDQIILEGMRGEAYEGKRGETAVALPSGQKVGIQVGSGAVPANTGLNPKKLRAARKRLLKAHVDLDREEVFLALSADEHDALFDFVEATSADYQTWDASQRPVFRDGKLARFLGFTLMPFESLPKNEGGTIRYCYAWVKSSTALGVWSDVKTNIWLDTSKRNTPMVEVAVRMDARRKQDAKVVEIPCLIPT